MRKKPTLVPQLIEMISLDDSSLPQAVYDILWEGALHAQLLQKLTLAERAQSTVEQELLYMIWVVENDVLNILS